MRFQQLAIWLTQRSTIGAQLVLIDKDQVLLVKHFYKSGWHLPGGGIDPPESPAEAASRELREETGYRLKSEPQLLDFVFNPTAGSARDYVATFVAHEYLPPSKDYKKSWEIKEISWFPLGQLPEATNEVARTAVGRIINMRSIIEQT